MRPHPRMRKAVKWGGLGGAIVLAALWGYSSCHFVEYTTAQRYWAGFGKGQLGFGRFVSSARDKGWKWGDLGLDLNWSFDWINDGWATLVLVPFWFLFFIVSAAVCTAWWLDVRATRLARQGHCPKCNYDRTGLAVGALCPECGGQNPDAGET